MSRSKRIVSWLLVVIGVMIGGTMLQMDVNAYFNPEVKQSENGNWMQCYALQYSNETGGGTFLAGAKIGHVASTERLCAYVDSNGNMITGNIGKYSEPSGTASLISDLGGKGYPKVYFEVKDNHTIEFHQCNDGSYGSECYSELAKTWTANKGDNFEALVREINEFANEKYGEYTKKPFEDNRNSGELTQDSSQEVDYYTPMSEEQEQCYKESGKLGWILCPVVEGASEAGTFLWDKVQEMLNVPVNEIFAGDSGVKTAWEAIRDIANVIFVVLLLMVIFSQLTGVGIDNYGIKRILPKLIVAAILINLSYVICELAIDISNILGNSLESLLADPAKDINYDNTKIAAAGLISSALGGGGAILYTLLGASAATGGLGIIALGLAVFGVIIAIVVAVIFIYLILVIRQAGVILLVVLAPAAIVCYMLPNTEKIFKRWLDIFKALLLVYPICGALIGAGQLGGAILASVGTTEMIVAAMIVTVAPFFLVPMLLKSSLALMGNLGGKLQNLAGRARGGVTGLADKRVRNDPRVQDYAEFRRDTAIAKSSGKLMKRLDGKMLNERQRNALARASHRVAAFENKREDMYDMINARNGRAVNEAEFKAALSGADAQRASSAFNTLMSQGGTKEALMALDNANWGSMNSGVRERLLQSMASSDSDAARGYAKYRMKGGTGGFKEWNEGTAADRGDAKVSGVGSYAQHLQTNGLNAMSNYSKDEMEFATSKAADLRSEMGTQNYGKLLSNAAINSNNATAQTIAENAIRDALANGAIRIDDLGITTEGLGSMRESMAEAILAGQAATYKSLATDQERRQAAENYLRSELKAQISAAENDPRVKNKMSAGTMNIFGMKSNP